jgi:hypothetical protein
MDLQDKFIQFIEEKYININDENEKNKLIKKIYFFNDNVCKTSFRTYIERFIRFGKLNINDLVYIHILFDRLYNKGYRFNKNYSYKIFAILTIIFSKMNSDIILPMSTYSVISGIGIVSLLQIEIDMLILLDYDLIIDENNERDKQIIQKYL